MQKKVFLKARMAAKNTGRPVGCAGRGTQELQKEPTLFFAIFSPFYSSMPNIPFLINID